jgi:spore coat assembly protein
MDELKVGDIVARKSYGFDIFFKVVGIKNGSSGRILTLKGISYRIEADAPESDLVIQPDNKVREYRYKSFEPAERKARSIHASRQRGIQKKYFYRDTPKDNKRFSKQGKILHIDGDKDYLETCLKEYEKLTVEAFGEYVPEKDQPSKVYSLLQKHNPDILILTGHDGVLKGNENYLDIKNYRNSKYFIDGVKEARRYDNDMDNLIIFAGACQSMYNEIIKAGANFASAPKRVLIHALDPVLVGHKIAVAGIERIIEPQEVINATITGRDGIGGVQTRGKNRDGYPAETYDK